MWRFFFFIVLFVSSKSLWSQQLGSSDVSLVKKIIAVMTKMDTTDATIVINAQTGLASTRSKYISNAGFDSLYKPIIGKVMLGDKDLVNQGSAYALSVDQVKSTFSINYNWARGKERKTGRYFSVGFGATSSSKVFPIFSKDQWQQGISLTFGLTSPQRKSLFFTPGNDYDTLKRRHKAAFLMSVSELLSKYSLNTQKLRAADSNLEKWPLDTNSVFNMIGTLQSTGVTDYEKLDEDIKKANVLRRIDNDAISLKKFVDSVYAAFETKYFKEIGYSFWWYNLLLRPEYRAVSIYDTTAAKIFGIQRKHYLGIGLEGYVNYVKSVRKTLFIFQGGLAIRNTNYLEGKKAVELSFLYDIPSDSVKVNASSEAVLTGAYEQYKRQFPLLTPSLGSNLFFGRNRVFGWELFSSLKIGINTKAVPFKDLLMLRTGPLFSLRGKDDLAKSTFGLLVQWEDVPTKGARFNDYFTFNIRIGIPFNL